MAKRVKNLSTGKVQLVANDMVDFFRDTTKYQILDADPEAFKEVNTKQIKMSTNANTESNVLIATLSKTDLFYFEFFHKFE
jgi:hypothetical protein